MRARVFVTLAEAFADERQHGGIGEMEQGNCRRKNEQRLALEDHAQTARTFSMLAAVIVVVQSARQRMIDLVAIDREGCPGAHNREQRYEPQHCGGRNQIASQARYDSREHIAGVIEGFIAADPFGETLPTDDSQAYRCDGRRERRVTCTDQSLRDRHGPEQGKKTENDRP